jgi:two-component system sensor histidine kinase RegB
LPGERSVSLEEVISQWQLVRPAVELRRTGGAPARTRIDPAVGHLLQALLNNAADAGEMAGRRVVDLCLDAEAGRLKGIVRDFGAGFARSSPPLPGTRFGSDKPGGLGIGLALSHATVERLGGSLTMHAAGDGPGARVAFELPTVGSAA